MNVIQDGLHHDELIARVKKNERRFQFTVSATREGLERRDGAVFENGTVGSRPSSSAKRKGRPPIMRPPDEFPTPAPKRQRRSEGSEGVHLNGDAMEIDAASASADADGDEDAELASPAVSAEPDMVELPERYDSMDVAVQTEVKTGPKTSTMYWKIDKPDATIYHSVFNPDLDSKNANTLLAVGESLCRFYQVPDDIESAKQVLNVDDPSMPPHSVVTAAAWHPKGHTATCAIDTLRELPDGRQKSYQTIESYNRDSGTSSNFLFPPLLEPAGIVFALRYSSTGDHLLVARTNLKRGLVLVYDTQTSEGSNAEPVAWRIFEHQVLDAAWLEDRKFIVCGENGLLESFELEGHLDNSITAGSATVETIPMAGTKSLEPMAIDGPLRKWDKVRVDDRTGFLALASTEDHRLIIQNTLLGRQFGSAFGWADIRDQLSAIAFQSDPSANKTGPAILATACADGSCQLYAHSTKEPDASGEVDALASVHLSEGPALALAWSANGNYLAVGGTDLVQIWETNTLVYREDQFVKKREDAHFNPLVTWRPDATAIALRNGEHLEDKPLTEPSLSWSADGESLSFAIDKQVGLHMLPIPINCTDMSSRSLLSDSGHRLATKARLKMAI